MARRKGSTQLKIGDKVTLLTNQKKEGVVVRVLTETSPLIRKDKELPLYEVHWVPDPKRVIGKRIISSREDRGFFIKNELIKVTAQMVLDAKLVEEEEEN